MPSPENQEFRTLQNHEIAALNSQAQKDTADLLIAAGFTFLATAASAAAAVETEGDLKIGAIIFAVGALLGTAYNLINAVHTENLVSQTNRELIIRRLDKIKR